MMINFNVNGIGGVLARSWPAAPPAYSGSRGGGRGCLGRIYFNILKQEVILRPTLCNKIIFPSLRVGESLGSEEGKELIGRGEKITSLLSKFSTKLMFFSLLKDKKGGEFSPFYQAQKKSSVIKSFRIAPGGEEIVPRVFVNDKEAFQKAVAREFHIEGKENGRRMRKLEREAKEFLATIYDELRRMEEFLAAINPPPVRSDGSPAAEFSGLDLLRNNAASVGIMIKDLWTGDWQEKEKLPLFGIRIRPGETFKPFDELFTFKNVEGFKAYLINQVSKKCLEIWAEDDDGGGLKYLGRLNFKKTVKGTILTDNYGRPCPLTGKMTRYISQKPLHPLY